MVTVKVTVDMDNRPAYKCTGHHHYAIGYSEALDDVLRGEWKKDMYGRWEGGSEKAGD